ncbi:hypothetical protein EEL33_08725 [Muribaculaceae bacterium Isolate-037 (Harlan)]|nr:hypothetical protein EEL33_08725 [Muribaculaceae bacterium Isolate-037 (Harlan)]
MTEQEYNEQLKKIDDEFMAAKKRYADAKRELNTEFVLSKNPYKVGDIVKDLDNRIIRITEISVKYSTLRKKYISVYTGILLTKNLTPQTPERLVEANYVKNLITPKD